MKKYLSLIFILMVVFWGCAAKKGLQPNSFMDPYYERNVKPAFLDGTFREQYDKLTADKRWDEAKIERNKQIWSMLNGVDIFYSNYRDGLVVRQAGWATGVDIAGIAMSTAGAFFNDANVLQYLAGASTVIAGSKLAVDKNFLQQQTAPIIAIKMDSLRTIKYAEIQEKLKKDCPEYTLDEAMRDVTDYFRSGTIVGALLAIISETGARQQIKNLEAQTK